MTTSPTVGTEIDAYCPKCRLNLDVVISAVHNGEIKQVQCRTCLNFVEYKPPADPQVKKDVLVKRLMKLQDGKRKGQAAKIPAAPLPVARARWEELTDQVDSRSARPYDRLRRYEPGQLVLHKKHGIGHVESADEEAMQMVVLFREGLVTLPFNEPLDD